MAKKIKSKYVEFFTEEFWNDKVNEDFSDEKFNIYYENHPSRMTREQINGIGYDMVRSRLWSDYISAKNDSFYNNLVTMSTSVVNQIEKPIKKLFPNMIVNVKEGMVRKYGDSKLVLPKLILGEKENTLEIIPTLNDEDDEYITIRYYIKDVLYNVSRSMNDIQMMDEIAKFNKYITTKEKVEFAFDRVCNKYENQYKVWFGDNCIELYDIEMVNLYHTLAKEMNRVFNTNFDYSEKCIKKLYKQKEFGNIAYNGAFYLQYPKGDNAELHSYYFYDDDKTHQPTFKCCSTYGDFKKDELIRLLKTLEPYVKSNYFMVKSKEKLAKKYNDYDRIGIRYSEKPDYFDVLMWED